MTFELVKIGADIELYFGNNLEVLQADLSEGIGNLGVACMVLAWSFIEMEHNRKYFYIMVEGVCKVYEFNQPCIGWIYESEVLS
ncbi:MAG: hypothetical protein OCD03_02755 [Hyphomicrobiales bacterium]